MRDLANKFLTFKRQLVDSGELMPKTWADYRATCENAIKAFGKERLVDDLRSDDFQKLRRQLAKRYGPVMLGNEINRVRILFKYAWDEELIDKPIRYGQSFKRPSKATLRKHRAKQGPRMFEAKQIRMMMGAASVQLKAMILLGINCGFGNRDVATLPQKAVDLDRGWINYPRPKTGIERRCPLWPETVAALNEAMAHRPRAKDKENASLVFITRHGHSWAKRSSDNPISNEVRKLLDYLKIHRPGLGFYCLRHTLETIGGESRDQVAVSYIMGHAPAGNDMSAVYRERISDDRLQAVVDHVHNWLFAENSQRAD